MANQRKKNKVSVGAWVDKTLVEKLDAEARRRGKHRSEILEWIIKEEMAQYGNVKTKRDS